MFKKVVGDNIDPGKNWCGHVPPISNYAYNFVHYEKLLFTTNNKFPNCFDEFYIVIVLFDVHFQLAMGEFFLKCLQNSPHWEKL